MFSLVNESNDYLNVFLSSKEEKFQIWISRFRTILLKSFYWILWLRKKKLFAFFLKISLKFLLSPSTLLKKIYN